MNVKNFGFSFAFVVLAALAACGDSGDDADTAEAVSVEDADTAPDTLAPDRMRNYLDSAVADGAILMDTTRPPRETPR